jgi:hypothetical protein
MPLFRPTCTVVILILSLVPMSHAQDETTIPTDDEIRLVLTQTERAMQSYKLLIDQEELQLGSAGAEAVAKDRQVLHGIEIAVEALKKQPEGFNGPAGFLFFEWLDDASRNALLCSSTALSQSTMLMMSGKTSSANELMHLSQSCMDASTLIYTVSENAGSLYERYAKAEQRIAEKGFSVAQKCADALKKMATEKTQQ